VWIVSGAILMATGIGHLIASNLQLLELQSEVNAVLPEADRFEPSFWSIFDIMRLRRLQRVVLAQCARFERSKRFAVIGFVTFGAGIALLLLGLNGMYRA
jgi:hypothetical protein